MPNENAQAAAERRRARRFPMRLSADVRFSDGTALIERRCATRDVGSRGVYFLLGGIAPPKAGSLIEFTLALPREVAGEDVRVCCLGYVTRAEPLAGRWGVAAAIEAYEFLQCAAR